MCKCGKILSIPNNANAPSPKPTAAGNTFIKPSPGLFSIAGANKLQKLAATITPPVKPSIPSKTALFIFLKKKTNDAPRAVNPQVKREAYNAANMGCSFANATICSNVVILFFLVVLFTIHDGS